MTKKTHEIGFYSLIQYCPDETVAEVANIGVLLFVPESGYVDARVTPTNQRIAQIFGGGTRKYDTLQRYKEGLSEWVKVEHRKFTTVEYAKKFLSSNANCIAFTPIRGIVCPSGGEKMLESLYTEFFPNEGIMQSEKTPRTPSFGKKKFFKTLQERYGKDIGSRLAILPELEIAGLDHRIQPAFAFQNDHFNIVFPQPFDAKRYSEQIGYGVLISSEMRMSRERYWKKSIPIILGRIPPAHHTLSYKIAETFKRHKISFYDNESALIDYVGKEAKPLPSFAREFAATAMEPSLF